MDYRFTFLDGSEFFVHSGVKGMKWGTWKPETARKYAHGNGGSNVSRTRRKKGDYGNRKKSGNSTAVKKKRVETVFDEGKLWKLKEDPQHKGYYIRDGLAETKKPKHRKLAVDGIWGRKTQAELQRQLGLKGTGKKDSATTKALQNALGVKSSGKMDKTTVKALNSALGSKRTNSVSVKVLQRALNQKKITNNR